MNKPFLVYWLLQSGQTLRSVLGPPELVHEALSREQHGGNREHLAIRPWIPWGAKGWSDSPAGPWRPLSEFNNEWFPQ